MNRYNLFSSRGFTLIEMVVVIVITGVIAGAIAVFIRLPVQGYADSEARAELTDIADTALRRIARDVRLSLPNSVRVKQVGTAHYLELLLTKTGARYLSEEENPTSGNVLSFLGTSSDPLKFDIVGTPPTGSQAIASGDYIVVYNLGEGISPADAYAYAGTGCTGCNITKVSSISGKTITMPMGGNPFQTQTVKMTSPYHRFQIVSGPVSYVCDTATGNLTRYWSYSIAAAQPSVAALGTNSALLASGITNCDFSYGNVAGQRSGLVGLTLTMRVPTSNSGAVTLFHQVHVDNTP